MSQITAVELALFVFSRVQSRFFFLVRSGEAFYEIDANCTLLASALRKLREQSEKQGLCTTSTFMKRSIAMPGSFRIGKIAGIDIDIHVSWIIILVLLTVSLFFFFQAEDGIRDLTVTGVQTCALPI